MDIEDEYQDIMPGTHLHSLTTGVADVLLISQQDGTVSLTDIGGLVTTALYESDFPEDFALETLNQYPEIMLEVLDFDEEAQGSYTLEELVVSAIISRAIDIVIYILMDKEVDLDLREPESGFKLQLHQENEK